MAQDTTDIAATDRAEALEHPSVSAEPAEEGTTCLNCGAALPGDYCTVCGQRRVARLTFRRVLTDAAHSLLRVDSRFVQTFIGMTLRPGQTARAYVAGQRQPFMNPVKYIFITLAFFLLMINVFKIEIWRVSTVPVPPRQFLISFSLLNYLIYLNLLVVAAVQRLLFAKRDTNYAECYVFGLFCYGQLPFFYTIAAFLGAYNSPTHYLVIMIGAVLYLAWALVGFYRTKVWRGVLGGVVLVVAYYVTAALFSTGANWIRHTYF